MVAGLLDPGRGVARRRSLLLDVLRIAAASWVVIFHWTGHWQFDDGSVWLEMFARAGYMGVDVFFMLSGAVIAYTALGRSWRDFASSRFLRLFPAYLAATVLVVLVMIPMGKLSPTPASWLNLTGLHFFVREESFVSVAWTLLYEVQFYVLIGVLIMVARNRLTESGIRTGSIIFLLAALFGTFSGNGDLALLTLSGFGGMFVFGALLGISRSRMQLQQNLPALFLAAAVTFFQLTGRVAHMGLDPLAALAWSLGLLIVVGGTILWSSMRPGTRSSARTIAVVSTLALMTYPMYLIHQDLGLNVYALLRDSGLSMAAAVALAGGLMILLSWLSVRFYEPAAVRLLRKWFGWKRRGPKPTELDDGSGEGQDAATPNLIDETEIAALAWAESSLAEVNPPVPVGRGKVDSS